MNAASAIKNMRTVVLILLGLSLVLFGCKNDTKDLNYEAPLYYFKSTMQVKVIHPIWGSREGYLVNLYKDAWDYDAGGVWKSAYTDSNGIARFPNIRLGLALADCRTTEQVVYYDSAYSAVYADSTILTYLYLDTLKTP